MIQEPVKQHVDLLVKEADDELLGYIIIASKQESFRRYHKKCPVCSYLCAVNEAYCVSCGYFFGYEEDKT